MENNLLPIQLILFNSINVTKLKLIKNSILTEPLYTIHTQNLINKKHIESLVPF